MRLRLGRAKDLGLLACPLEPVLKIGLIGCGAVAQAVHLKLLTRLPGAMLVALAESDPQRRQEAHRRAPSAAVCADYLEVVAMRDVEAVVICLPTALHAEAAAAALQQGKHVYLEKPLASSVADAEKLLATWRTAGVTGMIGFNYRFNKLYQAARRVIQAGRLGALVAARAVFSSTGQALPTWKQARATGGGVLLDLASHHVDLVHFLFEQPVREVFASLRSQKTEGDSAVLEMTLADGMLVQSFCSSGSVDEDRFEIYGQEGKLVVDRYMSLDAEFTSPRRVLARLKDLQRGLRWIEGSPYLMAKLRAPLGEPSYRAALAAYVGAIQTHQPARPDFYDGFQSLAVIAAAEESAATGRRVRVPLLEDRLDLPRAVASRSPLSDQSPSGCSQGRSVTLSRPGDPGDPTPMGVPDVADEAGAVRADETGAGAGC